MTDPTRAIQEAEPFAVSQTASFAGLGSIPHKDMDGNPITEPDLSNPTRSRWERPLDTIRSFEAAINKDARQNSSFYVVDTVDSMDQTQRQVQHNPGPYDSSLYHRNNGAQRYAPVDAYRGPHDDQPYRHQSIESFDRPRFDSRRHSLRSRTSNFEQMPPAAHHHNHNGAYAGYPTKPAFPNANRQYPDSGFQQSAPPSTPGSGGADQYSFGNNNVSTNPYLNNNNNSNPYKNVLRQNDPDLQFSFNDGPSVELGYNTQIDGQGQNFDNENMYGAPDTSHYTNNAGGASGNRFGNENANGAVQNAMNNQQMAIPRKSLSPVTSQVSGYQMQTLNQTQTQSAAPIIAEPAKKKKGLLQRFSKG